MSSSAYHYIQLLSTSFMNETAIPSYFLYTTEVIDLIQRYNWYIVATHDNGWTTLRRNRLYHN
jgi:hypothetical protein